MEHKVFYIRKDGRERFLNVEESEYSELTKTDAMLLSSTIEDCARESESRYKNLRGYVCTRPKGHKGYHIAHDGKNSVRAIWR